MYRYYMPIRKARMTQIIQTGDATIQRREPKLTTVIPVRIKRHGGRKVVIPAPESPEAEAPEHHEPILTALSRAFHWQRLLDEGQMTSRVEIARQEGLRQIQPPGCVRRDQCPPRPRFRINRTLAFAFDKVKRQMGR